MGRETGIAWTDATFNPWHGCTKVSPGCDNCYAEAQDERFSETSHWGKEAPRRTFGDKHWSTLHKWEREAKEKGTKLKVFVASMADVMDPEAPQGQRERLWAFVNECPNLLFQLLTKRPALYRKYLPIAGFRHDNVILGCTAEDQHHFDLRSRVLRDAAVTLTLRNRHRGDHRAPVKTFISYEPALGPITMIGNGRVYPDWLIFGGETGDNRRPVEAGWAESIKAECEELGVAFFMKQLGGRTPDQAKAIVPAHLLSNQFPEG